MEALHEIKERMKKGFDGKHEERTIKLTYKDIVLYADEMTASQVGWWQGRHEQLFGLPVVGGARLDLASADGGQLPALCLHDFVLGDVLDSLEMVTMNQRPSIFIQSDSFSFP